MDNNYGGIVNKGEIMFYELEQINKRPEPFEFYTVSELWTDEHTSKQMLAFHLNKEIDVSSRNAEFIDKSVDWIAEHFKLTSSTKIADFGCGPGLYTTRLARKQADVAGIDFSSRSIQYAVEMAAREELNIEYVNQNYLEFETDMRFGLIIMIMCDFCALSPNQRKIMLSKFHTFLNPGGAILIDVYSLKAFEERPETSLYEINWLNNFWSPNKHYCFINTFKYESEKVILDKYTIVEADRTRNVYNWLQHYSIEEIEREFMECGLKVEKFFADVAGSPFTPESMEFAVVTRKQ